MPFKKGKSGNSSGKPTGTKNAKSVQWEAIGQALLTTHSERFNKILKTSDDQVFAKLYLDVMEYFKPKQSRVETEQKGEQVININVKRT